LTPVLSAARRAWRAVVLNRQFSAALAVLLVALLAFPGSPGRSVFDEVASAATPFTPPTATTITISREALTDIVTSIAQPPPSPPVTSSAEAPLALPGPSATPPAAPEEPPPAACTTDAVVDVYDQVQGPVAGALGQPLPGRSVRQLAAIAAGCSDDDPTGAVLNLLLDLVVLVPDTGIDPVPLPRLPTVPLPDVPPEVIEALAPIAGPIRDGCANLAVVALLLAILPPAANLPVRGSDLAQLIAPASSVCAVFDEGPDA